MISDKLDREAIRRIVDAFYAKARADRALGPIFAEQVSDWPTHLERMTSFWASALLRERSYVGHPLQMHQRLPGLTVGMFATWLDLFEATVREQLGQSDAAQTMIDTAKRMGKYMVQNLAQAPSPMSLNSIPSLRPDGPIRLDNSERKGVRG